MRAVVSIVSAALALGASARSFEVAAWRGETVAARVPDYAAGELAPAPDGISVRYGVLRSVKYAPEPESLQRVEAFDIVDWGGEGDGPRVVEISVPADAKPGVVQCGMMKIRVVDRVLPPPKEWKYYLDLWQHPWAVARTAGAKPFSQKHYDAMKPVWELLATAGQKTITVPIVDMPWDHQCYDAYHSMIDDPGYRLFDEYVEFCTKCGLGPDISCYSLCPWSLGKKIDAAALEKAWGAKFDRFVKHLREKDWFGRTIMAMDERSPEDVAKVVDFVQRHAPGMRVSMAGNRMPHDFKGIDIAVFSQALRGNKITPEFVKEAAERAKSGKVTTFYVCLSPAHPNTFLRTPDGEPFWCGAASAFIGLDGFLRWAWNSWPQNPYKDASYWGWSAGDTYLCYPKGEPSWRFLELRNGIVAAEKVRILRESGRLNAKKYAEVAPLYDVGAANSAKTDFKKLRTATLRLVNN